MDETETVAMVADEFGLSRFRIFFPGTRSDIDTSLQTGHQIVILPGNLGREAFLIRRTVCLEFVGSYTTRDINDI